MSSVKPATRRFLLWGAAGLIVVAAASSFVLAGPSLPDRGAGLPSARVTRGPLKLTVYATGGMEDRFERLGRAAIASR